MFRFKRLFWKIFLSLWLSSFVVMMVTAVVIGELAQKDNFNIKLEYKIRLQAQRLLDKIEESDEFRQRLTRRSGKANEQGFLRRHSLPPIKIYDSQNELVLGAAPPLKGEKKTMLVVTESGSEYRLEYGVIKPRNSLTYWKGFILSVQALLILLSSTVASFIVSAIVVKPMNELRDYVKKLKTGDFSVRVGDKLQKRGDEIGDFANEFNQMAEYVERNLVGQQQLFQNVSHELRAPLARLLAASGIVEQYVGESHPAVARIQLECQRLTHLIDELLSLAKLQQQSLKNEAVDTGAIVEKVVADISFANEECKIDTVFSANVNTQAYGSTQLLERAVSNILGNALKHTPSGSKVSVILHNPSASTVQICVVDNGPGVDEEAIDKLCDPFFRLDTNVDGHGLGLGIAKQAMLSQQGDLSIERSIPQGLCVKLTLALANSERV